ncbi:MAG: type II 3-dehydroquinate dehydratase, partial [Candidatus Hydrogenedentota bacterium]
MKLLILNGPNLNMLGKREKNHYGNFSLSELEENIQKRFSSRAELIFFQSNAEHELIEKIQQAKVDGIVINAGAFTHTSIAIRDALLSTRIPFVEVHISNVYKRENFRQKSFLSDIALGVISGL